MNCLAVRDRLPEHALGLEAAREGASVDRHLAWCAACRKEAVDLQRAATTLAFALAPDEPDPELEGRVVDAVRSVAGVREQAPQVARRGRMVTAAVVAGLLAVLSLGGAAVMAGRAARLEAKVAQVRDQANENAQAARQRLGRFYEVFRSKLADPQARARIGTLDAGPTVTGPDAGTGAGAAMTILTRNGPDIAFVVVTGLQPTAEQLPYSVWLKAPDGQSARVGAIRELDTGGGGDVARELPVELSGFTRVVVTDSAGDVVLRGQLIDKPAPSPSA